MGRKPTKGKVPLKKGSKVGSKTSKGGGAKRKLPGASNAANQGPRAQLRQQEMAVLKKSKHAHGGHDAIAESRVRMKTKVLQKQMTKLGNKPQDDGKNEDRRKVLVEMGFLFHERGMTKVACENYSSALKIAAADEELAIRIPLLCLFMDEARAEEATELVIGPLFAPTTLRKAMEEVTKEKEGEEDDDDSSEDEVDKQALEKFRLASLALTVGLYTKAVLKYIKVMVLEDHNSDPVNATTEEAQLVTYLRDARVHNPFVAEFLIFAPAFERRFPQGSDLPPADECTPAEAPLREALEYCCHYKQVVVWTDTDEDVRRFMRHVLLEGIGGEDGSEEPPLKPLPAQMPGESLLLTTWRKAREEAMDLWAGEMSEDGGNEGEEEEEGEESEEENSEDALHDAEERGHFG